jgi:hypothetical protein
VAHSHRQTVVTRSALWRCAILLFAAPLLAGQPAGQPTDFQVKAAFLLNFTRYIEWPPPEPAAADAPFAICILGEDPFGSALEQTIEGESVNGQRIVIQRSRREPPKPCKILYVEKSERGVSEILTNVGRGVLTVGEGENFLREGGMIAFVLENHRVRFGINLAPARNASLRFSSKLLNVAKEVER